MARKIFKTVEWMILAVAVIILSLAYYLAQPVKAERVLFLPAGSTPSIIAYLQRRGFDVDRLDLSLVRFLGYPQKGWIDIGASRLTKGDFLYRITHAKAALVPVTLIPGETRSVFFDQLAAKFQLDPKKLERAYEKYAPVAEGVIWPDTYYVPKGIDESHLVYYLVHRSLARHEFLAKKFFGLYEPVKWFRYVTIASIVQKEAADEKEMPLVAGVIYNRLKKGMPLQMDGTLNYGKYSHVKVTKRRIEEDRTLFNTYRNKGLPPYPVGSVSLAALKAAIKPANVKYLYFVKGADGRHIFSVTYEAHCRAIRNVKKRNTSTH